MLQEHLNPDYSNERICPNCESENGEKVIDNEGTEGCTTCMEVCHFCEDTFDTAVLSKVLVEGYKDKTVIWKRGYVCCECLSDVDCNWKPGVVNVFEAIAKTTKPLTVEERIDMGLL